MGGGGNCGGTSTVPIDGWFVVDDGEALKEIMLVLLDEYRGFQWHPLDGRPEKSIGPTTLPSIITSRMITMRVLWMTVRCIFDREPQ